MAIGAGTRLGPYEIAALIGQGGMGEVYRATDTSLKRAVAIKVLPEALASDAERLARFQREAEVLASLNHPNIAIVHGLEKSDGVTALVMELVEGPTLAERLALAGSGLKAQGSGLPVDEALAIAKQMAEALEAAHEHGVVHRDLKPANVKVRPDGTVKVLDFGLAKAMDMVGSGPSAAGSQSMSPTITTPAMTQAGLVLGTASYMSPEQAAGGVVDQRSDIWSFGVVLYEMLTGRRLFDGDSVARVLAKVLERELDFTALPATTPPAIRRLLRRCLQRDRKRRLHHIADARVEIDAALVEEEEPAASAHRDGVAPRRVVAWTLAALVVGVAAAVGWQTLVATPETPRRVARFAEDVPGPFRNGGRSVMAFSPDGRHIVYNTLGGLYLRATGALSGSVIPGTEEPLGNPFFSPNGQSVAYRTPEGLKRIALTGGAPVLIAATTENVLGASWASDDTIFFGQTEGIMRVPAEGGSPPQLVVPAADGERLSSPSLLPDGDTLLISAAAVGSGWDTAEIVAVSLSSGQRKRIRSGGSDARYVPTGHLVYALGNALFVVPFDLDRLEVTGAAESVAQGIQRALATDAANYGISDDGALVYLEGQAAAASLSRLAWVDRDGKEELLALEPRDYRFARVSPDGRRFAVSVSEAGNLGIWASQVSRPALSPVDDSPAAEQFPQWMPDSERLVFTSTRNGSPELFWTRADGSSKAESLLSMSDVNLLAAEGWADKGETVVFTFGNPGDWKIGTMSLADGKPTTLIDRDETTAMLAISPDGNWVAYESDFAGRWEVFVERFPGLGGREPVSTTDGGWGPLWSPDGSELYYRRGTDNAMMAVRISTTPEVTISEPEVLFESRGYQPLTPPVAGGPAGRVWDIGRDGRFLMPKAEGAVSDTPPGRIVYVGNFIEELRERVPVE